MYKLLIADDESIIRKGIKNLIDFESLEIDQVFEAENGKEAVDLALKNKIDIVIMDINMPIIDGLSASKKIKEKNIKNLVKILKYFLFLFSFLFFFSVFFIKSL